MSTENLESLNSINKKRKTTTSYGDQTIPNPLKNFDLKQIANLDEDLDRKTSEIDYAFNSYKKRRYDRINEIFVSKIPKPGKNVMIIYSKYSHIPSKIPRLI